MFRNGWVARHRRTAAILAAGALCGAAPAVASAYWDYQGTLVPGASYGEAQPSNYGIWGIRMSRTNCNARMETRYRGTSVWTLLAYTNGCADSDNPGGSGYNTAGYDASHGINVAGTNVYVNIRIDGTF